MIVVIMYDFILKFLFISLCEFFKILEMDIVFISVVFFISVMSLLLIFGSVLCKVCGSMMCL